MASDPQLKIPTVRIALEPQANKACQPITAKREVGSEVYTLSHWKRAREKAKSTIIEAAPMISTSLPFWVYLDLCLLIWVFARQRPQWG